MAHRAVRSFLDRGCGLALPSSAISKQWSVAIKMSRHVQMRLECDGHLAISLLGASEDDRLCLGMTIKRSQGRLADFRCDRKLSR